MDTKGFRGNYTLDKGSFRAQLPVLFWQEAGIHYAYSPALDLTGYGHSEEEAKRSFELTMREFVEYTHRKKTIFKVLEQLGWTVNTKKKRVHPPSEEQLIEDNDTYRDLRSRPDVRSTTQALALAL